jgi:MoaA/NifB/PqqE/SkfB family radical SAM enzyme
MIIPLLGESKVIDLSLSNRCSNRCVFCGDVRGELPDLTTQQILRKLDESRRQGYDGLDISSKEFTLRGDAPAIIRHARDLGFRMIHLVTNGHLFSNRDKAALYLDSGVNKLTISLHGDSPETEEAVTRNPASFKNKVAAVANVLSLLQEKKAACVFSINTVMTALTAARLDRVMGFVAGLGVRRHNLYFPRIGEFMSDDFDAIVPRFSDVAGPLARGLDAGLSKGVVYSVVDVPPCVVPAHARAVCPRLRKDVFRGSDGGAEKTSRYEPRREKMKGEPCGACAASDACEGVFSRYVERRGWKEFSPMTVPG